MLFMLKIISITNGWQKNALKIMVKIYLLGNIEPTFIVIINKLKNDLEGMEVLV